MEDLGPCIPAILIPTRVHKSPLSISEAEKTSSIYGAQEPALGLGLSLKTPWP